MSETVTEPEGEHRGGGWSGANARLPTVMVVHHPNPGRIGQRAVVPAGGLKLGRHADILGRDTLKLPSISRDHLLVTTEEVRDLGSRNGITIDGRSVDVASLEPGALIGVGPVLLLFERRPAVWPGPHPIDELVGRSAAMRELRRSIERLAAQPATLLITGSTGVGKEVIAGAVHRASGVEGPMVTMNCAAFDDGVVLSELFGHERGAFSSAHQRRDGLVAAAAGGTLFLDEVGEASPHLQASLLRLLEQREYRPVGGDGVKRTDARFIAATNRELHVAVAERRFRQDLLARLERLVLEVPDVAARREDIILLVHHFIEQRAGRHIDIATETASKLLLYSWPNNVREVGAIVDQLWAEREPGEEGPLELTASVARRLERTEPTTRPEAAPRKAAPRGGRVRDPGAAALVELAAAHAGNVRAMADELGASRNSLYTWLGKHGITLDEFRR